MALNKLAFVIMPIKRPGTEEHQHFRALYDEVLKPTLESAGFVVQRADDIQKAGAISRDIILHLAEAAHVADELSYAWVQKVTKNSKGRQIPEGVDIRAELRQFVLAAFSCRSIDADCISQCRTAAERAEIDISDLEHALSNSFSFEPSTGQQAQTLNSTRRLSLADRVQIVTNLYQRLGSEVTLPEQAG
jgi:hypothetical protein